MQSWMPARCSLVPQHESPHCVQEFKDFTAETGFSSWERIPLRGSTSAAIAYK
jgi:hypothetical protein